MKIGTRSYGFEGKVFEPGDGDLVSVGNWCSCADGAQLIVTGRHGTSVGSFPFSTVLRGGSDPRDKVPKGPITIGHDVWICTSAIILSGVTLGTGSIVGAGAVVTHSCPPFSVIAGNPAIIVRKRFSTEIVSRLLALAWWDWPEEKVLEHIEDFYLPVETFLFKHMEDA